VAYIAPEQLADAETDGRCDQYSLACMAFECLTGRLPFRREAQLAVLTAHLTVPPPVATSRTRTGVPDGVALGYARDLAEALADA